jgi:L-ascorbate metabolism protein UlaG (beta-lactamase superfamily)
MPRPWPILAAALLIHFLPADAAEPKKVLLRWHGQSMFDIESSQGTRVLFDPHAIEAFGRKVLRADLVCISHFHSDHTQVGILENRDKARILHGLAVKNKRLDWNPIDEKFRDVHVRTVGVYHDTTEGMERGKNAVFIVEMDGLRFVHLGDLGHVLSPEQVKEIGPVDVLMIPVGGVYSINGSEAKKVVAQLKPRMYVLPMHYGTKVFDELLTADEFLDEQSKDSVCWYSEEDNRLNFRRFPVTNRLTIETDFKPAEPVIAILNWK